MTTNLDDLQHLIDKISIKTDMQHLMFLCCKSAYEQLTVEEQNYLDQYSVIYVPENMDELNLPIVENKLFILPAINNIKPIKLVIEGVKNNDDD